MRVSYHPAYVVPLPERHPFPMGKFSALRDLLVAEGVIDPADIVEPREADWADLLLVHTRRYLDALAAGTLTRAEERRMGLPWSEALVRRSRLAVQGTVNAMSMALVDGVAGNLAGGTHHAMPDWPEGFCVLNDVAVALRVLQQTGWLRRALVLDLDVHQGNGTAAFFGGDRAWPGGGVYTVSMHGANNYPFRKPPSTCDVGLPDGTGDEAYLSTLADLLPRLLAEAAPDLVVYLGGVDVVAEDRFGRLALSRDGLAARDRFVCETVRDAGVPLCLLLSGGYAARRTPGQAPETLARATASLHATMYREASAVFG
ncbi:MAG: histone deacetylase [Rhodothermaceae bacterium]|nr:histone deacetylase [Rhodothermaceae bacterium]MBC13478.1 histone deacetylase [Rhodothermaceae bacterium]